MGKLVLVLVAALSILNACGDESSEGGKQSPLPTEPGQKVEPSVKDADDSEYFGFVGRCLQKVERKYVNGEHFLIWMPKCSPLMNDKDLKTLNARLGEWHKENCSANVTYPSPLNETPRNCWVIPGEFYRIASPRSKAEAEMNMPGECSDWKDTEKLTLETFTPYGMAQCGL